MKKIMNSGALKYINNYLGGNLNIGTLTVEALTELMESYAKMKVINSKYNICDCCNDDRIGSTKLWCCNICGKRQEEFYKNEFNEL